MEKEKNYVVGTIVILSSIFAMIYLSGSYIMPFFSASAISGWFGTGSFMFILLIAFISFAVIYLLLRLILQ